MGKAHTIWEKLHVDCVWYRCSPVIICTCGVVLYPYLAYQSRNTFVLKSKITKFIFLSRLGKTSAGERPQNEQLDGFLTDRKIKILQKLLYLWITHHFSIKLIKQWRIWYGRKTIHQLGLAHKIRGSNEVRLKYASEWIRSSVSRLVVFDKKNFTRFVRSRLHRCKTTDFPFFKVFLTEIILFSIIWWILNRRS